HAYELASECGYDQEVAYVAGLVHDIGRLATQRCPGPVRIMENDWCASGFPLVYAETMVYGTDHAALGAELLSNWNMPAEIIEAVAFHHNPEETTSTLAGILNLAEESALDALPATVNGSDERENLWSGMRRAAAERLTGICGISRHQL